MSKGNSRLAIGLGVAIVIVLLATTGLFIGLYVNEKNKNVPTATSPSGDHSSTTSASASQSTATGTPSTTMPASASQTTTTSVPSITSSASASQTTTTIISSTTTQPMNSGPMTRLPQVVFPITYDLQFTTYLPSTQASFNQSNLYSFQGSVAISLGCIQQTSIITLQAKNLVLLSQTLVLASDGTAVNIANVTMNSVTNTVIFQLSTPICAKLDQQYVMTVNYAGILHSDLYGYYMTRYNEMGRTEVLAVTQFEATGARRAFPCFDEPAFKARFNINMTYPSEYIAISNGINLTTSTTPDGWSTTVFGSTPKMSTYLLAFAVAKFNCITVTSNTRKKTEFRLWARPSLIAQNQTQFAAEAGPTVLAAYEDYFDVPFPLAKQDLLAVPEFAAGAMENWGLVIFRETGLLYQKDIYPPWKKQQVAQFIAHEFAHMWFGDLVTMKWWDDLWLNEAFAQFMSWRGTDLISKYTWDISHQFVHEMQNAMVVDQIVGAETVLGSDSTAICYQKGSAILQMVNVTLGFEAASNLTLMQKGLTMYLNQYNQSNVVHQQLYDAWQGVVNNASVMGWNGNDTLNVTDFMTTWINYPGFPLLTVARDPSSDHIIVSQERFLLGNPSSAQNYHYRVPLWYWNQANNQTNMAWLNMDTPTQIPFAASNPFILLNPQGIGYYRVNYDANNWNQLITAISQSASLFDLRARSQLIDDAFAIARTDKLNYSVPFQLVGYLPTETSWIPWSTAMTALQYIGIMLSRTANYGVYQTYTRGLITNAYNNINFAITPDDVLQNNYNLLIAGTACNLGISACVNRFNASFSKAVTDCVNSTLSSSCNSIPANEREVAYCTGVRVQGAPAFNYLMQIYSNETDNMERVNIINGLACANEGWLVQSLLDACLNQGIVQSQTLFVYRKLAYNPVAVSMMAEYLITNWNNPVAQDDELVLAATRNLNTNYELSQLTGFAKNALNGDMLLSQVAVIQANVQWMNMYASDAVAAMQTYTIKF